ncbi:FaeA/PapI family transcriptional regulator [Marinobacter sp. BGYM27]|uniref:FaeA/PapI family transcriptional regulator n=1 Tax=Marinobacter sp. BGYM27 TaxID=2975597 RepID=UPI0021A499D9|nr:FaeA/PapI family transcriptional regulator [Marinobacter sp. BGYM27]MDG5498945.1 FaeA/PapI family transcriptional regulator [Marinobacter sp. BGYM27]
MSIEEQIKKALEKGPMHCGQVAEVVGVDAFTARAWLETLTDEGVIEKDGYLYRLPSGGDTPQTRKVA